MSKVYFIEGIPGMKLSDIEKICWDAFLLFMHLVRIANRALKLVARDKHVDKSHKNVAYSCFVLICTLFLASPRKDMWRMQFVYWHVKGDERDACPGTMAGVMFDELKLSVPFSVLSDEMGGFIINHAMHIEEADGEKEFPESWSGEEGYSPCRQRDMGRQQGALDTIIEILNIDEATISYDLA